MIRSLQMGRGIAALAVAAFHLSIIFADPRYGYGPVWDSYTHRGDLGVDFFFVLSGFIIMFAHHKDVGHGDRIGSYAFKRLVRVYPLYWLFTAIILLGAAATNGTNHPPTALGDIASVFSLVRFTGYAAPLGAAWTLYHEVFFYAVFGLLILDKRLGIVALAAWLVLILFTFQYSPHGDWSFRHVVVSASNLSFFCGIAAYFMSLRAAPRAGAAMTAIGLALVVAVFVSEFTLGKSAMLQFGYSFGFMLTIAGIVAMERAGRIPELPLLGLIGNASFTLYLCHESVESSFLKIFSKLGLMRSLDHRILYVVAFIGTVVFAIIFYKLVEKPMLVAMRRMLGERRTPPGVGPAATA